ncbi:hypothetical protein GKZ28_08060 [Clostridium chromiireducens]|jgi:hypothetical protein|uniref:Uncharacterized protein n=1 Tax=Clostridium chromiireducens TaxID=225345 RepID=A0A964RL71_9CLOT|nr:hypothetical protein [Clostridium chromiireducens]MVX63648.1 hypothetical protein [Clostridium chromiireducens]
MKRKNINTTLDQDLYKQIKLLAVKRDVKANDLIEEGMKYVLSKYKENYFNNDISKIENIQGDINE